MKKKVLLRLSCLAGLLVLLAASGAGAQTEGQVVARVLETAEPAFWKESGQWRGLDMEYYRALESATGLTFSYVSLPWSRALVKMREGTCTLMTQLSRTAEREQYMHFFGPYFSEEMVLVLHKDDAHLPISSLDDLASAARQRRLKIAIERDAWYGEAFAQKMKTDPAFQALFDYRRPSFVQMLTHKRILGQIDQRVVVAHKIRRHSGYDNFTIHPFTLNRDGIFFGISKKAPAPVVEALREAVSQLTADGTFAKIEARWKRY